MGKGGKKTKEKESKGIAGSAGNAPGPSGSKTEQLPTGFLEVPRDEEDYRYAMSFTVDNQAAAYEFFDTYGFVVFRDVLTTEECNASVTELFNLAGLDQADRSTWASWNPRSFGQITGAASNAVMTPQFLRNRQNPNVHRAFSTALGTENLLVNLDRGCIYRPTADGNSHLRTPANLHLDLGPFAYTSNDPDIQTALNGLDYNDSRDFGPPENNSVTANMGPLVQGVLNLADNLEEDGGFMVVPGFHRAFDAWVASLDSSTADQGKTRFLWPASSGINRLGSRVPMRAGSLVIWDQRCAHGTMPNSSNMPRCAQFIRMFPASTVPTERARRRAAGMRRLLKEAGFNEELSTLGRRVFGLMSG